MFKEFNIGDMVLAYGKYVSVIKTKSVHQLETIYGCYSEEYGTIPATKEMIKKVDTRLYLSGIKTIFVDEKATYVENNGYKSKSTCSSEDAYDPIVGFAVAYTANALFGGNKMVMRKAIAQKIKEQKEGKS